MLKEPLAWAPWQSDPEYVPNIAFERNSALPTNRPGQSLILCVSSKENMLSIKEPLMVPPPPIEDVYVPRTDLPSCISVKESCPDDTESAKVADQPPSMLGQSDFGISDAGSAAKLSS